jgi:hypothetical protein
VGFKALVGDYKLKRWSQRIDAAALEFPTAVARTQNILICLPRGLRELTLVKQFLPTIKDMFGAANISLISLPGIQVNDIYPRKGFQILSPSSDQVTWFGLPKRSYLETLAGYKFDMVLDLNLQPSRFTQGILLSFPKAVRVGRGNHLGRPYYNLEIKSKFLRDERNIYRSLLTILGRIKQSADQSRSVPPSN